MKGYQLTISEGVGRLLVLLDPLGRQTPQPFAHEILEGRLAELVDGRLRGLPPRGDDRGCVASPSAAPRPAFPPPGTAPHATTYSPRNSWSLDAHRWRMLGELAAAGGEPVVEVQWLDETRPAAEALRSKLLWVDPTEWVELHEPNGTPYYVYRGAFTRAS